MHICSLFPSNSVVYEPKMLVILQNWTSDCTKYGKYIVELEDLPFMIFKVYLRSQKASRSPKNSTAAITVSQVSDIKDVFSSVLPVRSGACLASAVSRR